MRALFIVNPAAGSRRARARWAALALRLQQAGIQAEGRFTTSPGQAAEMARGAADDYEVLVAVGGDGTAAEVANGLWAQKNRSTALGVVPFGTGNDYATALEIHCEKDMLAALVAGRTRTIDVIEIECGRNGTRIVRCALLFAGVGIISETLRRTTGAVKRLFGKRLAYPVGLARALCSYHSPHMRIRAESLTCEGRFFFACASNTEVAGGGMKIAPGAQIDDGWLNINLVAALGRWQAIRQLRRVCLGQHTTHPQVRYFPARSLEIDADEPLEVAADGDVIGHSPARFVVRPQALRVLAPPG